MRPAGTSAENTAGCYQDLLWAACLGPAVTAPAPGTMAGGAMPSAPTAAAPGHPAGHGTGNTTRTRLACLGRHPKSKAHRAYTRPRAYQPTRAPRSRADLIGCGRAEVGDERRDYIGVVGVSKMPGGTIAGSWSVMQTSPSCPITESAVPPGTKPSLRAMRKNRHRRRTFLQIVRVRQPCLDLGRRCIRLLHRVDIASLQLTAPGPHGATHAA